MTLLKYLSLVVLAVWIGGLGVLGGLAAPVLFDVIEARDPANGRDLAGAAFGAIVGRFQPIAWICGGMLLALFAGRAALGPRPCRMRVRVWIVIAMLSVSVATAVLIVPRIDRIRHDSPGGVARLAPGDERRIAFNRLHGLSNGLMLVTLVAGLALFWFEARDGA